MLNLQPPSLLLDGEPSQVPSSTARWLIRILPSLALILFLLLLVMLLWILEILLLLLLLLRILLLLLIPLLLIQQTLRWLLLLLPQVWIFGLCNLPRVLQLLMHCFRRCGDRGIKGPLCSRQSVCGKTMR